MSEILRRDERPSGAAGLSARSWETTGCDSLFTFTALGGIVGAERQSPPQAVQQPVTGQNADQHDRPTSTTKLEPARPGAQPRQRPASPAGCRTRVFLDARARSGPPRPR